MRNRTVALCLMSAMSAGGGCVVYRDRVVTVQTTRVEQSSRVEGDAVSVQRLSTSLGAVVELPTAPRALTEAEIVRALDGYGRWIDDPRYGPVWVPAVAEGDGGFTPYVSRGAWQLTQGGWYWQSDDSWGAVAFHYGRWTSVGGVWAWVPGTAFSPAWVDWRAGAGWVGWSPLAPVGAAWVAPYAYCASSMLPGRGLAARAVTGDAASSLYARTAPMASTDTGYRQGYGSRVTGITRAEASVDDAWAQSLRARSSAPTDGSGAEPSRGRAVVATTTLLDGVREVPAVRAEAISGVRLASTRTLDGATVSPFAGRQSVSLGTTYDLNPRVNPGFTAPARAPMGFGGGAPAAAPVAYPTRTLSSLGAVDAPTAYGGFGRGPARGGGAWAPAASPVVVMPVNVPSTSQSPRIDTGARTYDAPRVTAGQYPVAATAQPTGPWGSTLSQPYSGRVGAVAAGGGGGGRAPVVTSPMVVSAPGIMR